MAPGSQEKALHWGFMWRGKADGLSKLSRILSMELKISHLFSICLACVRAHGASCVAELGLQMKIPDILPDIQSFLLVAVSAFFLLRN